MTGEIIFYQYCLKHGGNDYIHDVRSDEDFQKIDVDFLLKDGRSVEIKTSKRRSFALNLATKNQYHDWEPSGFGRCKADLLVVVFPEDFQFVVFRADEVRDLIKHWKPVHSVKPYCEDKYVVVFEDEWKQLKHKTINYNK